MFSDGKQFRTVNTFSKLIQETLDYWISRWLWRWIQENIAAFGGDPNQVCLLAFIFSTIIPQSSWSLFTTSASHVLSGQSFGGHCLLAIDQCWHFPRLHRTFSWALLAIVAKYDVPIREWAFLHQALIQLSMKKLALWISVCADDWTAEWAIIASKE